MFCAAPSEGVGVAVCADAAIETAKKRETASDQGISRFVIQRSIEKTSEKGKDGFAKCAALLGLD